MLTLAQLQNQNSGIPKIAGVCETSQQFIDFCNEAVRRLLDYGNWYGSVVKYQGCIYGGCVTWPRYVGTVLATNLCRRNIPVVGGWYEFMPLNGGDIQPGRGGDFLFGFGWGGGSENQAMVVENDGTTAVFNQPPCNQPLYARFYPRCQNDIGKNITIFGVDSNGQQITSRDASNDWIPGATLTLALPYVSTPFLVNKIDRVVKDATQCVVDGYWYDPVNNVLQDMAHYQPTETNPQYQHSIIKGFNRGCGCNPSPSGAPTLPPPRTLLAYVKLKFIEMVNPNDACVINCLSAIKLMVQAVKAEEAGDLGAATNFQAMAIKELNRELRNKIPLDQVPVTVESFGTATPRRHAIGRMM